ncbi:MAG: nucleoside-triphosphatase [Desulfobacterales bacterium]|nr:nucleoside-triphosphatase [Desulfobacterales bacterium]MDD4462693.1 nucleoside-triphosphatase [Desulfobacterales bacterium]
MIHFENSGHRIILVKGNTQSGKSSLIEGLIPVLKQRELKLAGILAKGLWESNTRSGFILIDLKYGKSVPLARRVKNSGRNTVPFEFFSSGIKTGRRALSVESCAGADIIVVDEVGRLEIAGMGWAPFLTPLLSLNDAVHIWVVRTGLVDDVCRIWNLGQPPQVRADEPNASDRLWNLILEARRKMPRA